MARAAQCKTADRIPVLRPRWLYDIIFYMAQKKKKVMLAILDGWGVAAPSPGNAIAQANTPTMDSLERSYFATSLQASGIAVGLPWGELGNSEVGHMNLGAGYIVYQYLPRITSEIRDGTFFKNKTLLEAIRHVKRYQSRLHIMGLLSTGTVHSSLDHLYALLDLAQENGVTEVIVHAFTDGKDSDAKDGVKRVEDLEKRLQRFSYKKIGSLVGRMYGMDRNNNWDLTQKAYELITRGEGKMVENAAQHLEESYQHNTFDYDIAPVVGGEKGHIIPRVSENDALIFFNYREDSARQITKAFVLPSEKFIYFERAKIKNLFFVAMTEYAKNLPISVAYPTPQITNPLARVISDNGLSQLHIAESEKYAHVTFFFNGEHEVPYPREKRILVPSRGGPHYEKNPEMEAYEITQKILENIQHFDFFLINFANADIMGHTGNIDSVVKGIESIDANISALLEAIKKFDITLVITADHGNAEGMRNLKTGEIQTKHTGNPVPLYIIDEDYRLTNYKTLHNKKPTGILADVAPTILKLMNIKAPSDMTGKPLI